MMLPKQWSQRDLASVCDLLTDGTHYSPENQKVGDFPYITAKNIKWSGVDVQDLTYVSEDLHQIIYRRCPVIKGDVLLIKDGATAGIATINQLDSPFSMLSSVALLRPNPEILINRFLWYWLRTPETQDNLSGAMNGSAIRRLTLTAIGRIEIPIPPFVEQRRIVAKLDALTSRVARARAEIEKVFEALTNFRGRVVSSILNEIKNCSMPLSQIVVDIRYGTSKRSEYQGGATPVLRIPNVQSEKIETHDLKFADFDEKELHKLALNPGDILIIRSNGSISLVGRSAVVSEKERGMLYAGYLIRLRLDLEICLPEYLQFFLQSESTRRIVENLARSTSGVNNINSEHLRNLSVPVPSIKIQGETVTKLQAAFAYADRLKVEAVRATVLLDRFEATILAKAFRGELVPQDPTDEPASALLDRIRADRAVAPKAKRGRSAAPVTND